MMKLNPPCYLNLFFSLLLFSHASTLSAASDFFAGDAGSVITGNVLSNDGLVDGAPSLVSVPRFGQLQSSEGPDTISANGEFTYVPNTGFSGMDDFSYSVSVNGEQKIFQARMASGAVQILSANDPSIALATPSLNNRTPLELQARSSGASTHWQIIREQTGIQIKSLLSSDSASVIETWQPNAAGRDVTLYQGNSREWQKFSLQQSHFGNDSLVSRYTDFSIARVDGELTAQEPDGTSKDDWLITGVDQVPPPSVQSDRFVNLEVGALIEGNVLNNDSSNSADVAAFLVSGPKHGRFVGLDAEIYGGLAPFGTFSYQPDPGFEGPDSFTYIARGSANGAPSLLTTVTLQVGTAGTPIARDDLFLGAAGEPIRGGVLLNDTSGFASGSAVLVSEPRYGNLVGIYQDLYGGLAPFGDFDYQPPEGFNGVDSFAYKVLSNNEESEVATVFIVVGDVKLAPRFNWRLNLGASSLTNRTPVVVDQAESLVSTDINLPSTGINDQLFMMYSGRALETWMPDSTGLNATLYSLNRREWQRFGLELNDNGSLAIRSDYTNRYLSVEQETAGSRVVATPRTGEIAEQWLVSGPDQSFAPTARDEEFSITVDELLVGNVLANDEPNGFDFSAFPVTQPEHGSLVGIEASIYGGVAPWGAFRYQPAPGFVGQDSFVYQVYSSGNGAPSRFATVTITVSD